MDAPSRANPTCRHCGVRIGANVADVATAYCCAGCETAHGFVTALGFERYYDLRGGRAGSPADVSAAPSVWVDAILAEAHADSRGAVTVLFALRGLHCAACVWLVEKLFAHRAGAKRVIVEPGRGLVRATFAKDAFDLHAFVRDLASVGLRAAPYEASDTDGVSDELLLRLGLTGGLAMIGMGISFALYLGLDATEEPALYRFFAAGSALLALAAVLVALPVFVRGAWTTLRRGEVHVDLPIALGLVLAFVGSLVGALRGMSGSAAYFDSIETFAALMLLGRYMQQRQLERSRALAAGESALERWPVRVIRDDETLHFMPAGELEVAARVLLAKGELLVARGMLASSDGLFDAAARTGEGDAVSFTKGAVLPAGLRFLGDKPVEVVLLETFADSELPLWLGAPRVDDVAFLDTFWQRFVKVYVASILVCAAIGGVAWAHAGFDKALSVVVAVLVVTCPCAIGLAAPLAYELAHARLRERGIVVRSATFLDRLTRVRHVLFDKTGTLTDADPIVANAEALKNLNPTQLRTLAAMVASSSHPKSRALVALLTREPIARAVADRVIEVPGHGLRMEADVENPSYELAASRRESDAVDFVCGPDVLATIRFREGLRTGASEAVNSLQKMGKTVHTLSGDAPSRVAELAAQLGIEAAHAHARLSPDDKAAIVKSLAGEGTLYVGDGLNDGPAVHAATVSATPCIDRPMLPARVDAFGTSGDLRAMIQLFPVAERVAAFRRSLVAAALLYNVGVVALALAGLMSPLLCAILMPVSSLAFVAWTMRALGADNALSGADCPDPVATLRALEAS